MFFAVVGLIQPGLGLNRSCGCVVGGGVGVGDCDGSGDGAGVDNGDGEGRIAGGSVGKNINENKRQCLRDKRGDAVSDDRLGKHWISIRDCRNIEDVGEDDSRYMLKRMTPGYGSRCHRLHPSEESSSHVASCRPGPLERW
jgi:hypothetical protein